MWDATRCNALSVAEVTPAIWGSSLFAITHHFWLKSVSKAAANTL
jgi:hypothetical protein